MVGLCIFSKTPRLKLINVYFQKTVLTAEGLLQRGIHLTSTLQTADSQEMKPMHPVNPTGGCAF